MVVADYIINYLANCGIKDIFVVYGAANGDLIDAFTRTNKTRYVAVLHEQAGGFAAEAYAKISGKFGVAIATSGPGAMNLVTPIGNCYYDSVPCLFITGQVKQKYMRKTPALRQLGFQETDVAGIVKPITKYATLITNPEDARYELEKALFLMSSGRPGPVLLDIPIDVQKAEINEKTLRGYKQESISYDLKSVKDSINNYLKDLSEAQRPVIIVGGGVRASNAVEGLLDLGRLLKVPIYPTWNALDVVTSDYEYYGGRIGTYGGRGRNFGIQNSDLVLVLGSRISGRLYGNRADAFLRGAKKYLVDIDEGLVKKENQIISFDVSIHCPSATFISMLLAKAKSKKIPDFSVWRTQTNKWRDKYDPVLPEYYKQKKYVNPYVFFRILSEEMKNRDILVGDCGGNIVISNQAFETKHGQRNITNNGNSPMGFSFAATMGAWLAGSQNRHQNVVCTIGDGGFNMNIQELQTVKNYDLRFKTFIVNNHVYGITKQFQVTNFKGRFEACGPTGYNPPDFMKIVKAYGIKTSTIKSNAEVRKKIRQVLDFNGPIVCDVNCHEWHVYEPKMFESRPIEDMFPPLPRDEFRANMIIPPVKGWDVTGGADE